MRSVSSGLVVVMCAQVLGACASPGPSPAHVDAGSVPPASTSDPTDAGAGSPVVDAAAAVEDAGTVVASDAGVTKESASPTTTPPAAPPVQPLLGKAVTFDRVLVRPRDQGLDAATLQARLEKQTGLRLDRIRRTAGRYWLLVFAPSTSTRDAAAQQQLVHACEATGLFDVVEGERTMIAK